jgi:ribonuclease R
VPISTLGTEYFRFDEAHKSLVGEQTGETFRIGQHIDLRLAEANPISGALRFELPEGASHLPMPGGNRGREGDKGKDRKDRVRRPAMGQRGRPGNIRHQGRRR